MSIHSRLSKNIGTGVVAITLVLGGLFVAGRAEAFSMQQLITSLIERSIMSSDKEDAARTLARFFGDTSTPADKESTEPKYPHAEKISVKASQFIEFSDLTYALGADIEGIVLHVQNTHTEAVELTGRARCHVSYRIETIPDRTVLFNSAEHEPCIGGETSTYYLDPGAIRMFEIVHTAEDYALPAGEYVMVMEYPGYGEGELEFTVTSSRN